MSYNFATLVEDVKRLSGGETEELKYIWNSTSSMKGATRYTITTEKA